MIEFLFITIVLAAIVIEVAARVGAYIPYYSEIKKEEDRSSADEHGNL